jgi:hypothetical protein
MPCRALFLDCCERSRLDKSLTSYQSSSLPPSVIATTMYDHDNPNSPSHDAYLNTPSRNRPAQFNWRNCAFDCRFGCKKTGEDDGDGGGEGGSDDETAVESEVEHPAIESRSEDIEGDDERSVGFSDADMSSVAVDGFTSPMDSSECLYDMSGSMQVEPCATTDHSPEASTSGSARNGSRDPGIPYWITGLPAATQLPFAYYFLESPLRLSPQYEHCRGDSASHLVVPDRASISFLTEQAWRDYMPGYGCVSPPQVEGW